MSKFKVGDRVILVMDENYTTFKKGWTGVVKSTSSNWARVKWDRHDGDKPLAVYVEHLDFETKLARVLK